MKIPSLKSFLPKGLYGRAALILLLPIVSIQLVVSVVFIQRHFDGVTRQMVPNVVLEINHLLAQVNNATSQEAARIAIKGLAPPFGFEVTLNKDRRDQAQDQRALLDLTGKTVFEVFHSTVPAITSIDLLRNQAKVTLNLTTNKGAMSVTFNRSRVSASNPHQLLVLMVFTSILMSFISILFLRNQVRPIRRLARAAEAFGKGQIQAYHVAGATEVRSAGQAFLDMRQRIERQIEQRTLMLSGVSHDMRTPLTRLKLGLSLLAPDPEIAALSRDVDDLELMLDEFLAFARGDSTESITQGDPIEIAHKLVADAQRSGHNISLDIVNGTQAITPFPMRKLALSRALENLISNAARYGSEIRMRLEKDQQCLRFTVEDNGPGIPPQHREDAKKPFVRLDRARNQDQGSGVGLGLSIAMDIALSHGGTLELDESKSLGGLKATLKIPH